MATDSPATEVATIVLNDGIEIEDPSSQDHQTWREALSIISYQKGFQHAYYGHQLEDHSILQLVIDWDRIDSHEQFKASSDYAPFLQKLGSILAQPPQLFHFTPHPFPPAVLGTAPCVEMATFFQTADYFLSSAEKFVLCLEGATGYLGHSLGNVVEEIEKEEGAGKGKALLLCIGWESVDAHMAFRETDIFKDNVPLLRDGMGGVELHHTAFKIFK